LDALRKVLELAPDVAGAHNAVALDLANEANFAQDFIARMTFTHVA